MPVYYYALLREKTFRYIEARRSFPRGLLVTRTTKKCEPITGGPTPTIKISRLEGGSFEEEGALKLNLGKRSLQRKQSRIQKHPLVKMMRFAALCPCH